MNFFKRLVGKKDESKKVVWRRDSIEDSQRTRRRRKKKQVGDQSMSTYSNNTSFQTSNFRQQPMDSNIYSNKFNQSSISKNPLESVTTNLYSNQSRIKYNNHNNPQAQRHIQTQRSHNQMSYSAVVSNQYQPPGNGFSVNPYSDDSDGDRDSRGSYKSRGSMRKSEGRIKGNAFLNIPKVQTNYNRMESKYKPKKKREPRREPKREVKRSRYAPSKAESNGNRKANYNTKFMQSRNMTLVNPISSSNSQIWQPDSSYSSSFQTINTSNYFNAGERNQRKTGLKDYEELMSKTNFNRKKLFQNKPDLSQDLRLGEDIFDNTSLNTSMYMDEKSHYSKSRLEQKMNFGFAKKRAPQRPIQKKRTLNQFDYKFDLFDSSKPKSEVRTISRGNTGSFMRTSSMLEKEHEFERQFRGIGMEEVQKELNIYMQNPNENRLKDEIVEQNGRLTQLKNDLFRETMNPNNSEYLKKKIQAKEKELRELELQVRKENGRLEEQLNEKGIINLDMNQIMEYEERLPAKENAARMKMMERLQKLEDRCAELDDNNKNFDVNQDSRKFEKIQNSDSVIQKALDDINVNLDDKKFITEQMRKMLRYYQTLS